MSAQATAPAQESTKEIPQLTDAYRKAHKNYVLTAGLLASWELIGVTLQTKEKWGIELKSPAGVPLILFTLVVYSGYKLIIEWYQCDEQRRNNRAAKLDYRIAHIIAATAIGIPIVQSLTHIRIADATVNSIHQRIAETPHNYLFGFGLFLSLWIPGLAIVELSKAWTHLSLAKRISSWLLLVGMLILMPIVTAYAGKGGYWIGIGFDCGLLVSTAISIIDRFLAKQNVTNT